MYKRTKELLAMLDEDEYYNIKSWIANPNKVNHCPFDRRGFEICNKAFEGFEGFIKQRHKYDCDGYLACSEKPCPCGQLGVKKVDRKAMQIVAAWEKLHDK